MGIGMKVVGPHSTTETIRVGNKIKKITKIKDARGGTVATITVTQKDKSKAKSKTKRLQYNFKEVSSQIMKAKTSDGARRAVTKARSKVVLLQRKLKTGEYDDQDLERALIHARKMERIAKKKVKHLREEEKAEKDGICQEKLEEEEETFDLEEMSEEQEPGLSEQELKELMRELEQLMAESMEELQEASQLDELTEEFVGVVEENMDPEDLELLKKKHRSEELREINDADMKYLKALFDKLEKEKESASNGIHFDSQSDMNGVSLQLAGMDMPVEVSEPVLTEGGSIDVTI
ncbi:MAG: hypothetical protein HDR71_09930 [Lachnospiraceae bacterium]|nr:hypothetical protein [Lachnospiraceae bacterium]